MSDKDVLLSMGFDPARIECMATNSRGLQPAMDFLLGHSGGPVPEAGSQAQASSGAGQGEPMDEDEDDAAIQAAYGKASANVTSAPPDVEAKSIKCSQCGKTFKNTALANFHAEKSGHDEFEESTEEIKPLTEEEKKQKLAELREKMAAKRAVKAKQEAEEAKANELIRRKGGQDMAKIQEDLKAKQVAKDLAAKKREKEEEAKARAAVKAQIEADKRERAAKAAREKALREGAPVPDASAPAVTPKAVAPTVGRDYTQTRLQIRLASGGPPYTTTLSSDATLQEVAEFLAGQVLSVDVETVNFAQHFPRKQFARSDFSKSLRDLGLTPSAVCIRPSSFPFTY
ncbi:ubiquitin-related domain-containing protein [Vararia minispora EC-137]|uniref:Ubiquitin-related domain-containing protein n=1 Tax=Vararia minispora EC-137 TaxID=1314806 RepID=A0ACB8Q5Y2_9AGAM|nr:ubiquitin-related domain-containing protein [Vararia minispora EC-137]